MRANHNHEHNGEQDNEQHEDNDDNHNHLHYCAAGGGTQWLFQSGLDGSEINGITVTVVSHQNDSVYSDLPPNPPLPTLLKKMQLMMCKRNKVYSKEIQGLWNNVLDTTIFVWEVAW